jgi:hypothetical protein
METILATPFDSTYRFTDGDQLRYSLAAEVTINLPPRSHTRLHFASKLFSTWSGIHPRCCPRLRQSRDLHLTSCRSCWLLWTLRFSQLTCQCSLVVYQLGLKILQTSHLLHHLSKKAKAKTASCQCTEQINGLPVNSTAMREIDI